MVTPEKKEKQYIWHEAELRWITPLIVIVANFLLPLSMPTFASKLSLKSSQTGFLVGVHEVKRPHGESPSFSDQRERRKGRTSIPKDRPHLYRLNPKVSFWAI
jgi:hypothetical protein